MENCFADKLRPFLNVFQSEMREEKERDAAISILNFILAIQIFPKHTVTFLRRWCQYYWGDGCPDAGRLSSEETARLMSVAFTAIDNNDLFTVTNCRLSQNSLTRSNS